MQRTVVSTAAVALATALVFAVSPAGAAPDPLFDQTKLHEIRLYVNPADWQTLEQNYLADDYYVANIALDGLVIRTVGIRSRGSGSRSPVKPALKVDFNQFISQDYNGYKSIVLRNCVQDPSFLRETLSFAVFEAMGIPAPQSAFARLYLNDEYFGLYEVEEPVGKPFLKARLGEDGGNLFDYEYVAPYDLSFLGDNPATYIPFPFQPETNEKNLDSSGLLDFIRAVNGASDEAFVHDMGAWLDLDRFLTYVAVENALSATDGFVGAQGMNNFYLYQYAGERRFTLIPWDKDSVLQNADWPILARLETNVLTRRLLADPGMQRIYVNALTRAATSFVNQRFLLPRLESAYALIRQAALLDTRKPYTNDQFELGVGGLRGVIAAREASVTAQTGALGTARSSTTRR